MEKTICDRCKREVHDIYNVAGHDGRYEKQCATQICQGNIKLIRKVFVVIEIPFSDEFEVPF